MASLEALPFARLLLTLHRDGFSGWVELRRADLARHLELQGGEPVRLESSLARETLREHLVRRGLLLAEDRDSVAAEIGVRPGRELAAIVRLRRVAPRELVVALAEQVRWGIVDAVGWSEGSFSLEPSPKAPAGAPSSLPLDVVRLVCEAIAETWRADRTLLLLGERATCFPTANPAAAALRRRLPASPGVQKLYAALDGRRSAWELLRDAPEPLAHAALFCLDALDAVVWQEKPSEVPGAEAPEIEILVSPGAVRSADASPSPAAGAQGQAEAPSPEAAAVRARIVELHAQLGTLDHYEILGVARGAQTPAIRRAYLQLAKRLHPDAAARQGLTDIKAEAHDVFAEITRAHAVLSDPEERRSYDAALEGHSAGDAQQVAQAETLFRKGEILMKAGHFVAALELLDAAVRLWPQEADYQAALGWTLFKKTPPDLVRARSHLEQAVALNPRAATSHFRLHLVLKAAGDAAAAGAALSLAREIDPAVR
jgi:tetratricopeptide (TPR) repeat protein